MIDNKPMISVVIPMYNEQEVIRAGYDRIAGVMKGLALPYELIFINDGSKDDTLRIMTEVCADDSHARVIDFARNFGHQIAVTAGLDHCRGDAVVIIDADMQDPPELIPSMIEKWREGYDVVYGKRLSRKGETGFKRITAKMFYRFMTSMVGDYMPRDTGDFRLVDKKVLKVMQSMPEHARYLRGMFAWAGFKQYALEYERDERLAGETKYTLKKMLKLASDGIFSFSTKPLSLLLSGGAALGFAGLIYLLLLIIFRYAARFNFSSLHFVISIMLLCTGILLGGMGILGAYLGRAYEETKRRPIYIVGAYYGFEEEPS